MNIGGHPPIPLAQNNCQLWQFPSYFSLVFWVSNFWGRFEALNDGFWKFRCPKGFVWQAFGHNQKLQILDRYFQRAIERPNWRSYAKVMTAGSWLFNLPPWGRKLYDCSSSRVMFWTFGVLTLVLIINRPIWPHFVFNLAQMSVAATSLLRDNYHHSSYCIIVFFISSI